MTFPATAMTYGSYVYLKSEVGGILKFGRNEATWTHEQRGIADVVVQRGVRAFYVPPPMPKEKYGHEWSFLCPKQSVTTYAVYTTGTVTVASDAGGSIVTGVGTIFPSWAADGEIVISGTSYSVKTRTGDTALVLDDITLTVASASTYSLVHPPIYNLASDFAMLDGPLTYSRTDTTLSGPIDLVAEHQVRQRQQGSLFTGRPTLAAIRAREANAGYEILFYPTPDDAYTIEFPSKINPLDLSTSNTMPYGGVEHLGTVVAAVRAEAEAEKGEMGVHAARYMERLIASVSHDRKLKSPPTMGKDGDWARREWTDRHDMSNNLVTYNGVSY